jgi:hypothetical protein
MPKSGRMRRVPIFDSVLPVLRAMRLARGDNRMLWPGQKPGRPLAQPSVRKPFRRAVEHAELPEAQPAALGKAQNASVCLPAHGRASQAPGLGPTR